MILSYRRKCSCLCIFLAILECSDQMARVGLSKVSYREILSNISEIVMLLKDLCMELAIFGKC